jgi:hypothetical protein
MTTTNELKANIILNKPSDWIQWFFIVQDTAKNNKVWEYINLSKEKADIPILEPPKQPILVDIKLNAILIAQLN